MTQDDWVPSPGDPTVLFKEDVGGVCEFNGKWYGRSVLSVSGPPLGPFSTAEEVQEAVEANLQLLQSPYARAAQGQPLIVPKTERLL